MMKIGVSACLLGHNVRYDASNKKNDVIIKLLKDSLVVPICPEVAGGFNIPHLPCEIKDDIVLNSNGEDVSKIFISGANLEFEKIKDCDFVILKTKSPSCGFKKIYDGTFSNNLIDGNGIFAKLCVENDIEIYTEDDIKSIQKKLNKNGD